MLAPEGSAAKGMRVLTWCASNLCRVLETQWEPEVWPPPPSLDHSFPQDSSTAWETVQVSTCPESTKRNKVLAEATDQRAKRSSAQLGGGGWGTGATCRRVLETLGLLLDLGRASASVRPNRGQVFQTRGLKRAQSQEETASQGGGGTGLNGCGRRSRACTGTFCASRVRMSKFWPRA